MVRQTFVCFSLCPLSPILRATACNLQSVHTAFLQVCAGDEMLAPAPHQLSPSFHLARQSQVSQLFLLGGMALSVHVSQSEYPFAGVSTVTQSPL